MLRQILLPTTYYLLPLIIFNIVEGFGAAVVDIERNGDADAEASQNIEFWVGIGAHLVVIPEAAVAGEALCDIEACEKIAQAIGGHIPQADVLLEHEAVGFSVIALSVIAHKLLQFFAAKFDSDPMAKIASMEANFQSEASILIGIEGKKSPYASLYHEAAQALFDIGKCALLVDDKAVGFA